MVRDDLRLVRLNPYLVRLLMLMRLLLLLAITRASAFYSVRILLLGVLLNFLRLVVLILMLFRRLVPVNMVLALFMVMLILCMRYGVVIVRRLWNDRFILSVRLAVVKRLLVVKLARNMAKVILCYGLLVSMVRGLLKLFYVLMAILVVRIVIGLRITVLCLSCAWLLLICGKLLILIMTMIFRLFLLIKLRKVVLNDLLRMTVGLVFVAMILLVLVIGRPCRMLGLMEISFRRCLLIMRMVRVLNLVRGLSWKRLILTLIRLVITWIGRRSLLLAAR